MPMVGNHKGCRYARGWFGFRQYPIIIGALIGVRRMGIVRCIGVDRISVKIKGEFSTVTRANSISITG